MIKVVYIINNKFSLRVGGRATSRVSPQRFCLSGVGSRSNFMSSLKNWSGVASWGNHKKVYKNQLSQLIMFAEIFDAIGAENIFLILLFLISFAIVQFPLSRVFNKSPSLGSIVAFLVALGITAGAYFTGWDIEGIIFDLGFEMDLIIPITLLLVLVGFGYLLWKVGLGGALMALGLLFIGLSFFAYEKTITLIIGIVLLLLGLFFWWRKRRAKKT